MATATMQTRFARIEGTPTGATPAWLFLQVGKEDTAYFIYRVSDRIFRLEKVDDPDTVYSVDVESPYCTCPGFHYRGKCKHTDALAVLNKGGRI